MKRATPHTPTHAGGLGRHSPKGHGAFTLIELLVALTILAIMLSTIYATFFSALKAMRASRERDDTYQVARVAMERITNDLAMAFFRTDASRGKDHPVLAFIGRNDKDQGWDRDRLDFTPASHVLVRDGAPERDIAEVSYYIDDTYHNRPLLVRREDRLYDDQFRHGGALRILAEQVVALDFRYRERGANAASRTPPPPEKKPERRGAEEIEADEEKKWHDTWDAKESGSLPEIVEVTLTIRDANGRDHVFATRVVLHPYQIWQ